MCLRTSPPLGGTLKGHRTSWRIPFATQACMFLVMGFRGAWVSHAPPRVPKHRWPYNAAFSPGSGSRLAGSPALHGLPQCPGYGHWVSYCCVARMFGSGLCLGAGFGCALPLLAWVLGPVCVCVRAPLVPRHSWVGCAVWVCVLGLGFRLRPATAGWGVRLCVCLCARSASTPPLLAGVCGVGVCVWALVVAAPRSSWLGCWGVRVCVRALLVPRHSWLGWAVSVGVFGLGFWLRPASPGWGVGVFLCFCARPACTPLFLAGLCGVSVCAWARVSAEPYHF